MTKFMLYLCDNQVLMNAVGEGGKVMLVGELDADILREAIEVFREKKTTGAATFLVKTKAHRGEPANEEADIQADKDISIKDVPTEPLSSSQIPVFLSKPEFTLNIKPARPIT